MDSEAGHRAAVARAEQVLGRFQYRLWMRRRDAQQHSRGPARRPPALLPLVQSADTDAQQPRKFVLRQAELVAGRHDAFVPSRLLLTLKSSRHWSMMSTPPRCDSSCLLVATPRRCGFRVVRGIRGCHSPGLALFVPFAAFCSKFKTSFCPHLFAFKSHLRL